MAAPPPNHNINNQEERATEKRNNDGILSGGLQTMPGDGGVSVHLRSDESISKGIIQPRLQQLGLCCL
jgi:hypothetical protein